MKSHILITGAGGLIGSHICNYLPADQYNICALLKPNENDSNLNHLPHIQKEYIDLRTPQKITSLISCSDKIIHCAAINKLTHYPTQELDQVNIQATQFICKHAEKNNISKLIYTSSCEVYGPGKKQHPFNDNSPVPFQVTGQYERSKSHADRMVCAYQENNPQWVILRPTAVIGPGDINISPIGAFIRQVILKKRHIYYNAKINIIDARDVAIAHINSLSKESIQARYILAGHNIALSELIDMISTLTNKPHLQLEKITIPYPIAYLGAYIIETLHQIKKTPSLISTSSTQMVKNHWHFHAHNAKKDLHLSPRPLSHTIADTIHWLKG